MYDIGIIGAGPVGSYIAYKMSKLGHNVLVFDKKHHAGQDICCTGIIGKECLDLLDLDNEIVLRKANSATFFLPLRTLFYPATRRRCGIYS
jgi:flavin-dependent dehydrogenase